MEITDFDVNNLFKRLTSSGVKLFLDLGWQFPADCSSLLLSKDDFNFLAVSE